MSVQKKQSSFYSGKKKRHTIKAQLIIHYDSLQILSTAFCKGKVHDFQLFKKYRKKLKEHVFLLVDKGYQGLKRLNIPYLMPFKASKKRPLILLQKWFNVEISRRRIRVEHVIGKLKRFKILAERYRNRRKRMGLRFNLIAAIYNIELVKN